MKQTDFKGAVTKEVSFFMITPALLWQVLFFYIPLTMIVGASFIYQGGITWQHYSALLELPYFKIITRSLLFALVNAFVCLICAYPAAYFLARNVKKWKNILLFSLMLPFCTKI